jgi:hypothetical protein
MLRRPWSEPELEVLRTVYVERGLEAAIPLLPLRSRQSIYVKANKLGLLTEHRPVRKGVYRSNAGAALKLRQQGLSYRAIGEQLGMCEAAATNAVLLAECGAAGHRPLERGQDGRISLAGRERLRFMLRKGMRHRDIQARCGIAAATITRERRLYEAELKERRLAPLSPAGGGERYSGARLSAADRKEVERLYIEGWGAGKISTRTGVSRTHVLRIREALIGRLKRKRQSLAGCDQDGRRIAYKGHRRSIPPANLARLRELILEGEPVIRAARLAVVGSCTAYRLFHTLQAELAADGKTILPKPWRGKRRQQMAHIQAPALPGKRWGIDRYRALVHDGAEHEEAVRLVRAEWKAKVAAMPFEERTRHQLAGGGKIAAVVRIERAGPQHTLGGIATGALA